MNPIVNYEKITKKNPLNYEKVMLYFFKMKKYFSIGIFFEVTLTLALGAATFMDVFEQYKGMKKITVVFNN